MVELLRKVVPSDFIIKAVSWIIGEIGANYVADPEKI
jgi:hypothetical protein